jgi:hypothetical protein
VAGPLLDGGRQVPHEHRLPSPDGRPFGGGQQGDCHVFALCYR